LSSANFSLGVSLAARTTSFQKSLQIGSYCSYGSGSSV